MLRQLFIFSAHNKRLLLITAGICLLWSGALVGLWLAIEFLQLTAIGWSVVFVLVQLYLAAQIILPAVRLQPEKRSRGFYLFWALALAGLIWLVNSLPSAEPRLLVSALSSGLLLFAGTLIGIALARYVKRLWEVLPLCLVMMLADFYSWTAGPTAEFARQIENYYRAPEGPPPLIDMVLVKFSYPGANGLVPVFGISDWIIVVFFAGVAQRYRINDNLIGSDEEIPDQDWRRGRYLPVSVVALFLAIVLAHASGLFIPALPVIALVVLLCYAVQLLWRQMTH